MYVIQALARNETDDNKHSPMEEQAIKLSLTQCGELRYENTSSPLQKKKGYTTLTVSYCAICRTDAKMWHQGHRDLVLPRVLGHEIAGYDSGSGQLYTVWPGQSCGKCRYCRDDRENLCEEMRIIGFHSDGGFARHVSVPAASLIPVNEKIDPRFLTFAEPAACVLNALSRFQQKDKKRIIIYGGGVLGMMAALVCRERGWNVTVIEQSQEKISRLDLLCHKQGIELCKDTVAADYDIAINCCDSHIAFSLCITKLRKGGKLAYFSGLEKNEEVETALLNLIHYKELEVYGAYGPKSKHMVQAVPFCVRQQENLSMLIEGMLSPQEVESVLPHILSGNALKYIIDFNETAERPTPLPPNLTSTSKKIDINEQLLSPFLESIITTIKPTDTSMRDRAQKKIDLKTKPLGALGGIEKLAVQLSTIQNNLNPVVNCKRLFVFAGDHGIVEEGVSAFPSKVTMQMVENFLAGGAAINAFCRQYDIELSVIDMGVKGDLKNHPLLINRKVARGTRNFAVQQAMGLHEALKAVESGARVFLEKSRINPCNLIGMGEMGIGNSSSATAVICGASGLSAAEVAGRGTGVDDKGLERKTEVIAKALALHRPNKKNGLEILSLVGGYELGGICGAVLAAASRGCCVVLDGLISTAAGLLAYLICPEIKDYLIAGHKSVETGQKAALDIMGLEPVIDLDMRLGEGTGAAITMNLADLACRIMREMASFDDSGVDSGTQY